MNEFEKSGGRLKVALMGIAPHLNGRDLGVRELVLDRRILEARFRCKVRVPIAINIAE
jgi:hypothetical protein